MKKFFGIFMLCFIMSFGFTSCSMTYVKTNIIGDITIYNDNGDTLNTYENIVIETTDNYSGKNDIFLNNNRGLNFYDPNSKKYIIINNAVPVVITYDEYIRYYTQRKGFVEIVNKIEYITNDSIVQYREFLENRVVKNVKKNVIKRNK